MKLYTTDNLVEQDPHEYIFIILDLIIRSRIEIDPCSRRDYFHLKFNPRVD